MAEEIRRISCLDSRITDNPCMEPATWEVVGPMMTYYCDEHIEDRIAEDFTERWEQQGAVKYLHDLHDAIETFYKLSGQGNVTGEVAEDALYYLEQELERARQAYQEETGEEPPPTYAELDREAFVKEMLGEED